MKADSSSFEDWFTKAENDLRAGQGILYYYEEPPTDTICYHAHQTAEKSLKGFLIFKTASIPWVHDLVELLNLCIDIDPYLIKLKDDIEILNKYYIESKYPPFQPIVFPKEEAEGAILKAEFILKTLRDKICSSDV